MVEGLKFKMRVDEESISFLGIKVYKKDRHLETDVCVKSTDHNQLLLYSSFHPHTVFPSIPQGQVARVGRIVSDPALREQCSWIWYRN